jgi:hypothetical protein
MVFIVPFFARVFDKSKAAGESKAILLSSGMRILNLNDLAMSLIAISCPHLIGLLFLGEYCKSYMSHDRQEHVPFFLDSVKYVLN